MHAYQLLTNENERFVVYASLVELGTHCTSRPIDLLKSLVQYLRSLTIQVNTEDVRAYLNLGTSVLLLDSIDEGIAIYPEIVDSLTFFVKAFPRCQVITSSRTLVLRGLVIPFNQVSLLPFNSEQLSSFFRKWFQYDTEPVLAIENHLEGQRKLAKVVTNPLSATILCVLYENGVSLPKTEASLYKTRLDLFAGKFDREKGLSRLKNHTRPNNRGSKIGGI